MYIMLTFTIGKTESINLAAPKEGRSRPIQYGGGCFNGRSLTHLYGSTLRMRILPGNGIYSTVFPGVSYSMSFT